MDGFTLHVVCPNPALDHLQVVERFTPYEVNRVSEVTSLPGGKGMIVARVARRIGASVAVYGFVGGATGGVIRDGTVALGASDRHVSVMGSTRITPVVIDLATGRSTVLNEPGPAVTESEVERAVSLVRGYVRQGDVVVSTGSLPPGCPVDFHATIASIAVQAGAWAIVDAQGASLAAVLTWARAAGAGPQVVIKPNATELGDLLGRELTSVEDVFEAIHEERRVTDATCVVTMGAHGAIWSSLETEFLVDSPQVDVINATGSGDSFLAGLAVELGRKGSPESAMKLGSAMGAANAVNVTPDVDPVLVAKLRDSVQVTRREER